MTNVASGRVSSVVAAAPVCAPTALGGAPLADGFIDGATLYGADVADSPPTADTAVGFGGGGFFQGTEVFPGIGAPGFGGVPSCFGAAKSPGGRISMGSTDCSGGT